MSTKSRSNLTYRVPTKTVSTAVDFCANGCVNLHFGPTVVHLPEEDFLILEEVLGRVASDLRQDELLQLLHQSFTNDYH